MTRSSPSRVSIRIGVATLAAAMLITAGCSSESDLDPCQDRRVDPNAHERILANLEMTISADGLVSAELEVPLGSDPIAEMPTIVATGDEESCAIPILSSTTQSEWQSFEYSGSCESEVDISRLRIDLFDKAPHVDEIMANIKAPAASKSFIVSRHCSAPIFRF